MCNYSTAIRYEGRIEGREEGREEGRIEGREEGLIEGLKQGRIEASENTARRMIHANKFTDEDISQVTELSLDRIRELKAEELKSA